MRRLKQHKTRWVRMTAILALMISLLASSVSAAFGATDGNERNDGAGDRSALAGQESARPDSGHWAEETMRSWMERGLLQGYPDGSLRPDASLTRGELATLINRAFGLAVPPAEGLAAPFADVGPEHWAYGDIATAVVAGYLRGYGDGTMRPQRVLTRQEAVVIIARLWQERIVEEAEGEEAAPVGSAGNSAGSADDWKAFTDYEGIPSWVTEEAGAVVSHQLIQGYPDGSFRPAQEMKRAEVVVLMDRVLVAIEAASAEAGAEEQPGTEEEQAPEEEGGEQGTGVPGGPPYYVPPVTPGNPNPPVEAPKQITANGLPQAEIVIRPNASGLERLAAEELQQTVESISGARLPKLRGAIEDTPVSAYLWQEELQMQQSGSAPLEASVMNTSATTVVVRLESPATGEVTASFGGDVTLAPYESLSVPGQVVVDAQAADGVHTVPNDIIVDGQAVKTLSATVRLDRNLLQNSSFELGSGTGWNISAGGIDSQEARTGQQSMRMNFSTPYTILRTEQQLKLQAGQRYVLEAWVKASVPTGQRVVAQFTEISSDWQSTIPLPQYIFDLTDEWSRIEIDYTPQAGNQLDFVWAYLFVVDDKGPVWVDDITLKAKAASTQPEQEQPAAPVIAALDPASRVRIHLGTPDSDPELAKLFATDLAALQGSDGFAVRQRGNDLYILGTEPGGVLNGVYDVLEKNTGILWTRSTSIGTVYEEQPTIALRTVNYSERSPFELRGWHLTGQGAAGEYHADPGTEQMMARNKLNSKLAEFENMPLWKEQSERGIEPFNIGHNLAFWLPNEAYFAEHPDYYNTDANGDPLPVGHETQINFYHPDVPGVIAGRVADFLEENPIEVVGIGINDTHYFEQAGYSDQPFVTEDGITIQPNEADYKSTVFYTFLNKIARQVKVTNPGVQIATYAYFFTEVPPRIALEDNIVIVLAPISGDDRKPMNTPEPSNPNRAYVAKLDGWLKKTSNIVMYNYYGAFLSDKYERPIAAKVQADMRYYRQLGLTGVIPEGIADANGPNWGINALQFWLFQKLMWNPDANIEQLKTDYITKVFGPAAGPMATYYSLIEQGWNKYEDVIAYNTSTNTYIGKYIVQAGIAEAAQAALDEAWSLADAAIRARIQPIKTTFEAMVTQFNEIPSLQGEAVYTTADKEAIVGTTDFTQGPWADAPVISDFYKMNSTTKAPVQTKVRLLWDDDNLYVAYENMDPDIDGLIVSDSAPNEWWASGADDENETFITGEPNASSYYVFFNNPGGLKLEYSGPAQNSAYNGAWEAYTSVQADRWTSIQVIPFASIQVNPEQTQALQGYFFRSYHGMAGHYGWGTGTVWDSGSFLPIALTK